MGKTKDDIKKKTCTVCGGLYTIYNKSHHDRTTKHLKTLEIQQIHEQYKNEIDRLKKIIEKYKKCSLMLRELNDSQ